MDLSISVAQPYFVFIENNLIARKPKCQWLTLSRIAESQVMELFNLPAINKCEAFVANHGLITIDYGVPRLFLITFHLILQVVEPGCVAIDNLRIGAVQFQQPDCRFHFHDGARKIAVLLVNL